jgi:NAD(P)-dependent dehydrogenase (short-subunit alcohol dehydrogenase family)
MAVRTFTDPVRPAAVAQAAVGRFGRIDILVNNAGRGLLGAVEEPAPNRGEVTPVMRQAPLDRIPCG